MTGVTLGWRVSATVSHCLNHSYLLSYLLTPWSRVLPEKLTGPQLFNKFRAIYRTKMFITACKTARCLSLS